jgi:hypothetical protein
MQPTGTDSQQKEASIDFPNHCSERDFYVGAPEQAPLRGEKSAARAIESQFQTRLNTRKFINLNPQPSNIKWDLARGHANFFLKAAPPARLDASKF